MSPLRAIAAGVLALLAALVIAAAAGGRPSSPEPSTGAIGRVLHLLNQMSEPGPLTAAHAALDTDASCGACHSVSEGVPDSACLSCHGIIAERQRQGLGWHGRLTGQCVTCHSDHAGADFDIMPFDRAAFNHDQAVHRLEGAHRDLQCSRCHIDHASPENVGWQFLQLPRECFACHESPHGAALSSACASCHTEQTWSDIHRFDHDALTAFPLTGAHRDLECQACHGDDLTFAAHGTDNGRVDPPFDCAACHENVHRDDDLASCARCHSTQSWLSGDFDHDTMTAFPLASLHRGTPCDECHRPDGEGAPHTFSVRGTDCATCHRGVEAILSGAAFESRLGVPQPDIHHGVITCQDCHSPHDRATHLSIIAPRCVACHTPAHGAQLFEQARLVEESVQAFARDTDGRMTEGPLPGARGSDLIHNPAAWLEVTGAAPPSAEAATPE